MMEPMLTSQLHNGIRRVSRPRNSRPSQLALCTFALLAVIGVCGGTARAQTFTVALDANTGAHTSSGSQTSINWTHTVGSSATNVVLLVAVSISGTNTVSSVTWSGTNPTFSCLVAVGVTSGGSATGSCSGAGSGAARRAEIWGAVLGTPATQSGTLTVNFGDSSSGVIVAGSVSYSGAAQTSTFGTAETTAGTNSPASLTFSGVSANGLVMDDIAISTSQPITSLGSGQNSLWSTANNNGAAIYGSSSYKTGAVTSMSQSWTGGSTHWAYVGIPINPAAIYSRKGQTIVSFNLLPHSATIALDCDAAEEPRKCGVL